MNPYTFGENVKYFSYFESSLAVSYHVKHTFAYDPAILLLGVFPREINISITTGKQVCDYLWWLYL